MSAVVLREDGERLAERYSVFASSLPVGDERSEERVFGGASEGEE